MATIGWRSTGASTKMAIGFDFEIKRQSLLLTGGGTGLGNVMV